jgi:GAF domain-containing protein
MSTVTREEKISDAFVTMTGALMKNYDIVDLLSTLLSQSTEILDMEAGGILLVDAAGELELVASTSEEAQVVETIIIAAGAGPCINCYKAGAAVSVADIRTDSDEWPKFRETALREGFRSTYAVPMRIRDEVIGVMNLLSTTPGPLSERDGAIAQSLADIAVLGILHERNFRNPHGVGEQLHLALDTRILVEQAKGVLAHGEAMSMTDAFQTLRGYARRHDLTLRAVAEAIVYRQLSTADLRSAAAPHHSE